LSCWLLALALIDSLAPTWLPLASLASLASLAVVVLIDLLAPFGSTGWHWLLVGKAGTFW